jgi:putative hemolysin
VKRDDGWLTDIIRYMILTYFDLDELINDYEVTTVGLNDGTFAYPKQGEKLIWKKFQLSD